MHRWAPFLLMVASGFAGLGYQIVWTQQSSLWLGHETAAVLAVVTAFFGGLALGGLALGSRIEASPRPVRWYAGCELLIVGWSLLLLLVLSPVSAVLQRATGVAASPVWQWSVAFFGAFLLFLPATAAMGATLPAMERLIAPIRKRGRSIAALYAGNTFGAVLGVLASAFWLIPAVGLRRTAAICIALNLLCGATALAVFRKTAEPAPRPRATDPLRSRGLVLRLAITGFLGIGYEVLVVRVLSQVTEDTVYTFAMLLAVYLVGTAAGAAGYRRWLEGRRDRKLGDRLLTAMGVACLLGTASLWSAEHSRDWARDLLGAGAFAAIGAEAVLALAAFGPPTMVMGALFSHLCRSASAAGITFGRALGVNTLAAAAAPVVFGVIAIPVLGPKLALLSIALGYLAATTRPQWTRPSVWLPASAAALGLFAPPLAFVDLPDGARIVSYREGVMATVSVIETRDGVARLHINNRQQEGSSTTHYADARQAWLPLLLHPAPQLALFLGLGTGVTASSAAEDPMLEVDAVELLPEVIAASTHFVRSGGGAAAPRLNVMAADARRYVRATDRHYAVIVSDNFHPARSGSGALYTVEHFEAVRLQLEPRGLFCQWLPLHQLDLETLRSIVRSFVTVYPHSWAMIASNSLETPVVGLVARRDQNRFDLNEVRNRLSKVAPEQPIRLGVEDEFALLGGFFAGPEALGRFAGSASPNTDDHPVVAYSAPRITYAPDSRPRDRLIRLLRELSIEPDQLVLPPSDSTWPRRLGAYWAARHHFVESGRDVRPSARVEDMLGQVREPLLAALRISPDFRPAYDPLLSMATALARSDISGARALLAELERIQPARAEASQVMASLGGASAVQR